MAAIMRTRSRFIDEHFIIFGHKHLHRQGANQAEFFRYFASSEVRLKGNFPAYFSRRKEVLDQVSLGVKYHFNSRICCYFPMYVPDRNHGDLFFEIDQLFQEARCIKSQWQVLFLAKYPYTLSIITFPAQLVNRRQKGSVRDHFRPILRENKFWRWNMMAQIKFLLCSLILNEFNDLRVGINLLA